MFAWVVVDSTAVSEQLLAVRLWKSTRSTELGPEIERWLTCRSLRLWFVDKVARMSILLRS